MISMAKGIGWLNYFYIGIAVLDIYNHKPLTFGNPELAIELTPYINSVFSTGIDIKLSEKWVAKPHTIIRQNDGLTEIIIGTIAQYKNKFNFGVNYSNQNNWDYLFLSGGYQLKALSINYGFNIPLSRILSVLSMINSYHPNWHTQQWRILFFYFHPKTILS